MNVADQLRDLFQNSAYGPLVAATIVIILILIFWKFLKRNRQKKFTGKAKAKGDSSHLRSLPKDSSGIAVEDLSRDASKEKTEISAKDISREVPGVSQPKDGVLKELRPVEKSVAQEVVSEQDQLSTALTKTRDSFWGRIKTVLGISPTLSSDDLESIEEVLYTSDLGPKTVSRLMEAVNRAAKADSKSGIESFRLLLKAEMLEIFRPVQSENSIAARPTSIVPVALGEQFDLNHGPSVWMMVGINGAGKTTTIGKLATLLAEQNKKVLLAAGDTFRAAAGEQLKVWTERAQVEIFNPPAVSDPSAVAFDAVQKAKAKGFDVVIIDTAGRLHTQKNLMEELRKMKRVLAKILPDAPHETLLVLDANQGQNALLQAKEFHDALGVTGIVLTKLDGTAKGGVALGVANELNIPIKLIGVGEKPRDLRSFSAEEYVNSILGL